MSAYRGRHRKQTRLMYLSAVTAMVVTLLWGAR